MKKTFRKAIAVLLAVLMVAFSVPFTALAEEDSVGWWGDNNWDSAKNPELLAMLQEREDGTYAFDDYQGWNSATWDYGLAWSDAISPETDLEQGADALNMVKNEYKPTLTISVWDQGTADNRIYRKYYGYGTSAANAITYDTAVANGYKLNPADLKAGQRIAVVFEIGGFDMIYGGQIKGLIDKDYLAFGYYKLNPASKDQWTQCSSTQTTQAGLTRGYQYYGTAVSDGTGIDCNIDAGQIYVPFSGNAAPPASSYVGTDAREFGEHGMYIAAISFEVLQDCNLADVLHMDQDLQGQESRLVTVFTPYAPEEVGESAKFTFQTTAESVHETAGLIALNWDGYEATGDTACAHENLTKTEAVAATCTEAGTEAYWTCDDCGKLFSDADATTEITAPVEIPALNHKNAEKVEAKAATCTEAGNVEYWSCPDCGKLFTDDTFETETSTTAVTIAATGHSYGDWAPAGTNEDGAYIHTRSCTSNDDTQTAECTFGAMQVVTPATPLAEGTGKYTCTVCGQSYEVTIPKTDCTHTDLTKTEAVPATCTEAGTEAYWTCNTCGKLFSDADATTEITAPVEIPATGHTPVSADNAVAPTCTEDGKEADTVCAVCGITLEEGAVLAATGHTPVSADNAVAPTCTEDGKEADTVCAVCGITLEEGAVLAATGHTPVSADNAVAPTFDQDGKEADTVCAVCGALLEEGAVIPALDGVDVTVTATDLGATAIGDTVSTNGATVTVLKNSSVTLTATPAEGTSFVGWALNGKIVSSAASYTVTALADVTYTPVFTETSEMFTVVFVDSYGNVISTQQVASAADIVAPETPARPGYTFTGWSEDYTTLTQGTTIYAQFEKDTGATYTVTAEGCVITTADGESAEDSLDVAFDTKVTVTPKDGTATSWKVGDATVSYEAEYTFYVGTNVTVVPQFDAVVKAVPTVTAINGTTVTDYVTDANGKKKAVFLATRSMSDDCKLIAAGYIYGLAANVTADTTLADVNGSSIRRMDAATDAEQFGVTCSIGAQSGTLAAIAFVAYTDADGAVQVIYADRQTFTY